MRPTDRARWGVAFWGTLGAAASVLADEAAPQGPRETTGEPPGERAEEPAIRTLRERWRTYLRAMSMRPPLPRETQIDVDPGNAWEEHRAFLAAFDAARGSLLRGHSAETINLARLVFERQEPVSRQAYMMTRRMFTGAEFLTVEEWERRAELLYRLGREGKIEPETLATARETLRVSLREAIENEILGPADNFPPAERAAQERLAGAGVLLREAMSLVEEITERPIPRVEDVPAQTRERILSLVAQLGAADFQSREEATRALVAGGDTVLPFLVGHLSDPDAEIAARARRIWAEIY